MPAEMATWLTGGILGWKYHEAETQGRAGRGDTGEWSLGSAKAEGNAIKPQTVSSSAEAYKRGSRHRGSWICHRVIQAAGCDSQGSAHWRGTDTLAGASDQGDTRRSLRTFCGERDRHFGEAETLGVFRAPSFSMEAAARRRKTGDGRRVYRHGCVV